MLPAYCVTEKYQNQNFNFSMWGMGNSKFCELFGFLLTGGMCSATRLTRVALWIWSSSIHWDLTDSLSTANYLFKTL